jgi:hypothetical protein
LCFLKQAGVGLVAISTGIQDLGGRVAVIAFQLREACREAAKEDLERDSIDHTIVRVVVGVSNAVCNVCPGKVGLPTSIDGVCKGAEPAFSCTVALGVVWCGVDFLDTEETTKVSKELRSELWALVRKEASWGPKEQNPAVVEGQSGLFG